MALLTQTTNPLRDLRSWALINPFRILDRDSELQDESFATANNSKGFSNLELQNVSVSHAIESEDNKNRAYDVSAIGELRSELAEIFSNAEEEIFADGMVSDFSNALLHIISEHGKMAMNQIILLVEDNLIKNETLAEALRWLGNMEHAIAYEHRRWLLEHCLTHPSVIVRDGAILGLSFLEDPRSILALKKTVSNEVHQTLQEDIRQVIAELELL